MTRYDDPTASSVVRERRPKSKKVNVESAEVPAEEQAAAVPLETSENGTSVENPSDTIMLDVGVQ